MAEAFRTDLRDRLPLPLARLYRRAHNANSWLERHGNALYLLEAAVKHAASAQVSAYLASGTRLEDVDRRLRHLSAGTVTRPEGRNDSLADTRTTMDPSGRPPIPNRPFASSLRRSQHVPPRT